MTKQETFFNKYAPLAIAASEGKNLFPSVFLAQAALESGWGESSLAKKYNNFFGIKADKSWKGKRVSLKTQEVYDGVEETITDAFRVYNNPSDSFYDRANFLIENQRYAKAGVFDSASPEEQSQKLKAAGYATAPNYAQSLINVINLHSLKQFDVKKK